MSVAHYTATRGACLRFLPEFHYRQAARDRHGQHGGHAAYRLPARRFRVNTGRHPRVFTRSGPVVVSIRSPNALHLLEQRLANVRAKRGRDRAARRSSTSPTVPAVSFRLWRCSDRHHERRQPDRHVCLRPLRARMGRRRRTQDRQDRVKAASNPLRSESVTYVGGMNCHPCVRNGPSLASISFTSESRGRSAESAA